MALLITKPQLLLTMTIVQLLPLKKVILLRSKLLVEIQIKLMQLMQPINKHKLIISQAKVIL